MSPLYEMLCVSEKTIRLRISKTAGKKPYSCGQKKTGYTLTFSIPPALTNVYNQYSSLYLLCKSISLNFTVNQFREKEREHICEEHTSTEARSVIVITQEQKIRDLRVLCNLHMSVISQMFPSASGSGGVSRRLVHLLRRERALSPQHRPRGRQRSSGTQTPYAPCRSPRRGR